MTRESKKLLGHDLSSAHCFKHTNNLDNKWTFLSETNFKHFSWHLHPLALSHIHQDHFSCSIEFHKIIISTVLNILWFSRDTQHSTLSPSLLTRQCRGEISVLHSLLARSNAECGGRCWLYYWVTQWLLWSSLVVKVRWGDVRPGRVPVLPGPAAPTVQLCSDSQTE